MTAYLTTAVIACIFVIMKKPSTLHDAAVALGRKGGEALKRAHGLDHFAEMGRKGIATKDANSRARARIEAFEEAAKIVEEWMTTERLRSASDVYLPDIAARIRGMK